MSPAALIRWTEAVARAARNERVDVSLTARQVFNDLKRDRELRWLFAYIADRYNVVTLRGETSDTTIDGATAFAILAEIAPECAPARLAYAVSTLEQLSCSGNGVACGPLAAVILAWISLKCGSAVEFMVTCEQQVMQLLASGNDACELPSSASFGLRRQQSGTCRDNNLESSDSLIAAGASSLERWVVEQADAAVAAAMPYDSWGAGTPLASAAAALAGLSLWSATHQPQNQQEPAAGSSSSGRGFEKRRPAPVEELTVSPQRPTSSHDAVLIDEHDASPARLGTRPTFVLFSGPTDASNDHRRRGAGGTAALASSHSSSSLIVGFIATTMRRSDSARTIWGTSSSEHDAVVVQLLELLLGIAPPRSTRLLERAAAEAGANAVPERRKGQFAAMCRVATLLDTGLDERHVDGFLHHVDVSARVRQYFDSAALLSSRSLLPQQPASGRARRLSQVARTPNTTTFLTTPTQGLLASTASVSSSGGPDSARRVGSAPSIVSTASEADTIPASPSRAQTGSHRHDSVDSLETSASVELRAGSGLLVTPSAARSHTIGEDEGEYSDAEGSGSANRSGSRREMAAGPNTSRGSTSNSTGASTSTAAVFGLTKSSKKYVIRTDAAGKDVDEGSETAGHDEDVGTQGSRMPKTEPQRDRDAAEAPSTTSKSKKADGDGCCSMM